MANGGETENLCHCDTLAHWIRHQLALNGTTELYGSYERQPKLEILPERKEYAFFHKPVPRFSLQNAIPDNN